MISHPEQAIQLILSTLLYYSCATVQWPKFSLKLLQENLTCQAHLVDGEPWILPGQNVRVIVKKSCLHYPLLAMEYLHAMKNLLTIKRMMIKVMWPPSFKCNLVIIHLAFLSRPSFPFKANSLPSPVPTKQSYQCC